MIIETNGIEYFTEIHQREPYKPHLILLHGFMGSGRSFKFNIPMLNSYCNPITIDLCGHGKTTGAHKVKRFMLDRQLNDIHFIISKLSLENPSLLGYSMGGRLALQYALAYPRSINGLILESTHYGLDDKEDIERRKQVDEQRACAIEDDFESFLDQWKELPLFRDDESLPKERRNHYLKIQKQQNPLQMARSLRGFGAAQMPSVKKKLDQLEQPVLLLAGEHDEKYINVMEEMYHLIPNCTFSIMSGAGHRVHLDTPKAHSSSINKFINKA